MFFGPTTRPLFGWLHRPELPETSSVGLVICSPLGYEAICSHRTLRHLARAAAAHGIPALRFDYDGTGDSAGDDTDPDRLATWLSNIQEAVTHLRSQTHVESVCVLGIRLGATMALLASQNRTDVSAVVLINPVVVGRKYLRELRALAATSSAETATRNSDADIQEAAGFITTAATRLAIGGLALTREVLGKAPPRVLFLDRTDLPSEDTLAAALRDMGASVERHPMPGYADMLRDAQDAVVPEDSVRDIVQWICTWRALVPARIPATPDVTCSMDWPATANAGRLRETVVNLGATDPIFGLLTEACDRADAARPAPALLLLNAGAVHHIGPNRLYVQIARHLAARGFKVVRMDLPGLGDSPAKPGLPEHQIYPDHPERLILQAIESVRRDLGSTEIHCAGICSGAYHSLKAAVAGAPLASVIPINPLTFFWKPEMSLEAPAFRDTAEVMRYRRTALSAKSLRKLFTGQVDLVNLATIFARFALRRVRSIVRRIARALGIAMGEDLAAELRRIRKQGTRMHFVFASTDPGPSLLREEAGGEVHRLSRLGALTISFIEGADHTFTPFASQIELRDLITAILTAQPPFLL